MQLIYCFRCPCLGKLTALCPVSGVVNKNAVKQDIVGVDDRHSPRVNNISTMTPSILYPIASLEIALSWLHTTSGSLGM